MKKKDTTYFCSNCGYESAKWTGRCPSCHEWNTMVEAPSDRSSNRTNTNVISDIKLSYIEDISVDDSDRYKTGYAEFDRVLGGGIVSGSLILVGGDPGIGKSTILLQVCRNIAADGKKVIYISGEESLKQIKLRAMRIGKVSGELRFLCETNLDIIDRIVRQDIPDVIVIDSIQTMYCEDIDSSPGSISQVRESTNRLMMLAKGCGIAIFIVGHVTKEGQVAGPRVLEHMVDTVLYFEGDKSAIYRILHGVKNRFGSTNEIGVFEMQGSGLVEVPNPSEYMLSGRPIGASGAVVSCSLEGTRPIMIEVQSLVCKSAFGLPRRTAVGVDYNKVNLLMAVLEKRCHYPMSEYDAYVNIAGGIRMNEPAIDLAITIAIVSSLKDIPCDEHILIFGEVGLSGEVRAVSMAEQRVREAAKLGFTKCIMPKASCKKLSDIKDIQCIGISTIKEAIEALTND